MAECIKILIKVVIAIYLTAVSVLYEACTARYKINGNLIYAWALGGG